MKISDDLYALYLQFFTYGVADTAPQYSLRTSVMASVVQALGINDGKLCGKLKPGPNPAGDRYKVKCRSTLERDLDFAMASSTPTAETDSTPATVVTVHNTFNLKDDPAAVDALVAAFNRVTKPAKPAKVDESRWQTFVDAAIGLGLRAHVDGATGEVKVVSPSTYYLDKGPKTTPDARVAKLQALAFVSRHSQRPYEALVAMSDEAFSALLKHTEEMVASEIEAATKPV